MDFPEKEVKVVLLGEEEKKVDGIANSPIIIPYKPDFGSLPKSHEDFHLDQFRKNRQDLLSELRCVSGFPEIFLSQDTLYRVVLPKGELLQKGKDGFFRGVKYSDRGIDQHVKFAKVSPSLMDAAKAVGSQVLLISIAMQLNHIEQMVESLSLEMHYDRIAQVRTGVDLFEKAMLFQDLTLRGHAILNAIQTLEEGLHKTISELGRRIAEAPDSDNNFLKSFLYHLTHWNKTQKATKIIGLAQESFYASLRGIKTLAECYAVLGETGAGRKSFSDYFDQVRCNVGSAAEKARLVKFSGSVAPQEPWEKFNGLYTTVKDDLQVFSASDSSVQQSAIDIEFMPSELKGDNDANLP